MLIIIDKQIPEDAKIMLEFAGSQLYGTLVELETKGLVYPAISGHPDIFFCQAPQTLVISPNLPQRYWRLLDEHKISYIRGNSGPGKVDPYEDITLHSLNSKKQDNKFMVSYNAAANEEFLVHRLEFTDPVIIENCYYLKKVAVRQGYTRCNLLLLKDRHYITSDHGIHETLKRTGLDGLYVAPEGILLPGFPNGFIGGTMGIFKDNIYILGSLKFFPDGLKIAEFLGRLDYCITELYDGPLFDGGGVMFVEK